MWPSGSVPAGSEGVGMMSWTGPGGRTLISGRSTGRVVVEASEGWILTGGTQLQLGGDPEPPQEIIQYIPSVPGPFRENEVMSGRLAVNGPT